MSITVEKFANAVETTLDGAINNSVTSIVLDDASTFPTVAFRIKIEDEILWCISRSGNTLSVIRGYESTTAASHIDGSPVNHSFTVGSLQSYRKQILADCAFIDPTDSMSADDDDFDDENFTGWSLVERSGYASTILERNHRLSVHIPGGTSSAQHYGILKAKVPTGGSWVQCGFQVGGGGGNYPIVGLCFTNGATYGAGNQLQFTFSANENRFFVRNTSNWSSNAGESGTGGTNCYNFSTMHLRMQWNSANNYTCWVSPDCISWAQCFSAGSLGSVGTPSHVGLMISNWGAPGAYVYSFTYCRFNW